MKTALDDILEAIDLLDPEESAQLRKDVYAMTAEDIWVPNFGPQTAAVDSEADELFYGGQAGGGKLLDINELLPTPDGWKAMGDIAIGDTIFDETGAPARVMVVSPIKEAKTYRLAFDDGSEIVCCADHLWLTYNAKELESLFRNTPEWRARRQAKRSSRSMGRKSAAFVAALSARNSERGPATAKPPSDGSVRTTQQIVDTLLTKRGRRNHAVPVAGAIQTPRANLPIDPYTLGAWLGDGTTLSGGFTGIDPEIWQRIEAAGYVVTHSKADNKQHYIRGLVPQLRAVGVLGNKHVPAAYLRGSIDQRLALLQGLMDTDGHAALDGGSEFDNTNRRLIDAVYELACSLGIKASITEGVSRLNGVDMGPRWRVKFTTAQPVFYLPRKVARLPKVVRGTSRFRYIVDAIEIDPTPMKCIAVDSPTRLYLAGRSFIPTHNTDLLCGLSLTEHERSLILRRLNSDTSAIVDRMAEIIGNRSGLNNSSPKIWRRPDGRVVEIGGCQWENDKQKYKGRPHDLIGFDEISDFSETQFRFIIGWNRSAKPGQRCRVVCTGNPPTTPEGLWVLKYWGAWLDPTHPNPAKDGELRWYTTIGGQDVECDGPEPIMVNGELVKPVSRTFIRSRLSDNPDLASTNYDSKLAALPSELRDAYRDGRFDVAQKDNAFQLIPTEWIKLAQSRWTPEAPGPMSIISNDVALGGGDANTLARRHGFWFDEVISEKLPPMVDPILLAMLVIKHMRDGCPVVIDMGGGYGSGVYSHLQNNVSGIKLFRHNGASSPTRRSRDGKLEFYNMRAQVHWLFREALEPGLGFPIALPPDPELLADLSAPTWKLTPGGIKVEDKEAIAKRLGRSPDKGDAVLNAWSYGEQGSSEMARRAMQARTHTGGTPKVNVGRMAAKRARR